MCAKGILTSDEIITKWKKFLLKMHHPPNSMNKKNYLCRFAFPSFAISLDYCGKLIHHKTLYLYDRVHPLSEFFVFRAPLTQKLHD